MGQVSKCASSPPRLAPRPRSRRHGHLKNDPRLAVARRRGAVARPLRMASELEVYRDAETKDIPWSYLRPLSPPVNHPAGLGLPWRSAPYTRTQGRGFRAH